MSSTVFDGIAIILLAAGRSRRFGKADKLAALLHGKPLGLHAAETLALLGSPHLAVVMADDNHPCRANWQQLGFLPLVNQEAATGQASSVALAARFARQSGARAVCIALADMPFVERDHMIQLGKAFADHQGSKVIASSDNHRNMPPAIFPARDFLQLEALTGDEGARDILRSAHAVRCDPATLVDVDTAERLSALDRQDPAVILEEKRSID